MSWPCWNRSFWLGAAVALGTVGLQLSAGCAGGAASVFSAPEFPLPPPALDKDPSGGVILKSEGLIQFMHPTPDGQVGPKGPYVVVRRQWHAIITGTPVDPALTEVRLAQSAIVKVDLARARLARPDGTAIEVDGLTTSAAGGEVVVRLPAAKPGDRVDFLVQRTLLIPDALTPYVFAGAAPTVESRLEIAAPNGWDVKIVLGQGANLNRGAEFERKDRGDGVAVWSVVERNVRAVPTEPEAVDPQRLSPWATVVLASATVGGVRFPFADSWKTVAGRIKTAIAGTIAIDDAAKADIGRGLAKARLRNVRLKLKPTLLREGILDRPPRTFSELSVGGASPLEAAAVAAAATADSMEKGTLALVAPFEGPVLLDDLPGLYAFRTAVVAFKIGGNWVFGDPTCSSCEFGKVSMAAAGGRALILTEEPTLVDIALNLVEPNRRRLQFDWTLSIDGTMTGRLMADLDGYAARTVRAEAPAGMADAARRAALGRALLGAGSGVTIEAIDKEGDFIEGETYSMGLKVSAKTTSKGEGLSEIASQSFAGVSLPMEMPKTRRNDMLLAAPMRIEVTSTIELPGDGTAHIPTAVEARVPVGEYSAKYTLRGQSLTLSRRVDLFARSVPAAHYNELASFFEKVIAADKAVVTIKAD
jgi:hypothetical protein